MWVSIQASYCIQKPKSLELMNRKKNLKMDNLHFFLPNNILTRLFKALTKYKNDYQ